MARTPRMHIPGEPMHITRRMARGECWMRPSEELNSTIAGIVGHFAKMYEIVLFAYVFLFNHYHMLASAPCQWAMSMFMRGVNRHITMALKKQYGWDEHVALWDGRFGQVTIRDDAMCSYWLDYIVANGCKEGLVAHPAEWPGLTVAHQLETGVPDKGVWIDETGYLLARKKGLDVDIADFTEYHELWCEPLPDMGKPEDSTVWAGDAGRAINLAIAERYLEERIATNAGPVKGVWAILHEEPGRRIPKRLDPLPLCSTVDPELKRDFLAKRKAYVSSYRYAKGVFKRQKEKRPLTELMELFPPGCCIGHVGWRKADVQG